MGDKQISLLKKHGLEGVSDSKISPGETVSIQRQLDTVYQKANAMAHINTQGASLQLFMPEFAGWKGVKPLTLYKRMAYAATTNMMRNTKDALKDIRAGKPGGVIKLALIATTPYLAGSAMLGLYYHLLGEDPPKENSDWMTRVKTNLWKGEFLGIISDSLSPFSDRDGISTTMQPALYGYFTNLLSNISGVTSGKKSAEQFREDFGKQTFAAYNTALKVIRKKNNPYNRGFKHFNTLWKDFEEEEGPDTAKFEFLGEGRWSKEQRDLRDAWNLEGPTEEFVRIFLSLLSTEIQDRWAEYGGNVNTYKDARDESIAHLTRMIKHDLHPNPAFMYKGSKKSTNRLKAEFIAWLHKDKDKGAEYMKELSWLNSEYNKRIAKFESLLRKALRESGI